MSLFEFLWGFEQNYQAKRSREAELLELRRREVEAVEALAKNSSPKMDTKHG